MPLLSNSKNREESIFASEVGLYRNVCQSLSGVKVMNDILNKFYGFPWYAINLPQWLSSKAQLCSV
jgi:hypothetical protein